MTEDEQRAIRIFACRSVGETFTADDWRAREILLNEVAYLTAKIEQAEADAEDAGGEAKLAIERAEGAEFNFDGAVADVLALRATASALNAAVDAMWNDHDRVLSGRVRDYHLDKITKAQAALAEVLK